MNAYELADQVEMWGKDLLALNMAGGMPCIEGATMLRQQADRIAELEKDLHMIERHYDQLDKDVSNKPVAWMETYKGKPNNLDWEKNNLNYGSDLHDVIPLYTHPVKQLSDEEIHNLMDEIEVLVHGDIKRAMYRMARKVESILNE